jgi:hypothetical protein
MNQDMFLADFDKDGHTAWAKHFGTLNSGVTAGGVAVDGRGNIGLGGTFSGALGFGGALLDSSSSLGQIGFAAKLDPSGAHVFSTAFTGGPNSVSALAFDGDNNLLAGGVNQGAVDVGGANFVAGAGNGFVAKLGPDGTPQWAFQLGGDGSAVTALAADGDGNVIVGGSFASTLIAGSLQAQGAGSPSVIGTEGFVLAVDKGGQPIWLQALPSVQVGAVAAPGGGGALVTGRKGRTAFATSFDGSGVVQGSVTLVSIDNGVSLGTGIGPAGSAAVIAGSYNGTIQVGGKQLPASSGAEDLFVARLSL